MMHSGRVCKENHRMARDLIEMGMQGVGTFLKFRNLI
jgi:hypothetical protein